MSFSVYNKDSPPTIDIWEACSSANAAAVEYHLTQASSPVDPNAVRGVYDDTLLMYTAMRCAVPLAVFRVLLENGADVNARNAQGNTALHLVCAYCPLPADPIRLLLEKGADANVRNENGKAPIHLLGLVNFNNLRCVFRKNILFQTTRALLIICLNTIIAATEANGNH